MLAKRIIAVLTFDNGSLTRTKNFIQDYKYTNNLCESQALFDTTLYTTARSIIIMAISVQVGLYIFMC